MPALILPLVEVAPHLPARGAWIGLDLGSKTRSPQAIPTAGSPRVWRLTRKTFATDATRLLALAERKATGFVLGLPINMDGAGPRAHPRALRPQSCKADRVADRALGRAALHAAVERELIAADVTRAKRAKIIDQHAALFILQGALDRLARGTIA
jgi:putative Holliday junction resolvase